MTFNAKTRRRRGAREARRFSTGWLVFMAVAALAIFATPQKAGAATCACTNAAFNDTNDLGRCSPPMSATRGDCPPCQGLPRWWVSQPYNNVWLADEPLNYAMSSGQRMAFRWTYSQRSKLPDPLWSRVQDIDPPWVQVRLLQESYVSGQNTYRAMTNASWCHNWWSEIVFWDPLEENGFAPTNYIQTSTNTYYPMSTAYQGIVLLGDGGLMSFDEGASSTPAGPLKAQVQFLGSRSAATYYGPEVPVSTNSSGAIYEYPTNSAGIVWVNNPQYGFQVNWPDGSKDIYGFVFLDHAVMGGAVSAYHPRPPPAYQWTVNATARALLTQHIDPQGRVTRLGYQYQTPAVGQPLYVMKYVVDPDGLTNTYSYNPGNLYQLQQIQDPYGRTAAFQYDSTSGMLTSITDAAGLTNSFQYNLPQVSSVYISPNTFYTYSFDGVISNLFTPYGKTTFEYYDLQESGAPANEYEERAIFVSEPQSAYQLFLFRQADLDTETNYLASGAPSVSGWTFDNGTLSSPGGSYPGLQYRNTYEWGREQFANAVPSANLYNWPPYNSLGHGLGTLAVADYHKARLKHWLLDKNDPNQIAISDWLSSERPPSPDAAGLTLAPRTWYAYSGQPANNYYESGTEPLVGCVATVLPDGTSQYQARSYDLYGNLNTQRLSYARSDGTVGELTNFFAFATNNIDLLAVTNSAGQWANVGYNANHQPVAITNALNQVATRTWDSGTHNLTGLSFPNGQTVGLTYAGLLSQVALWPQGRVINFVAYTNGLPQVIQETGTGLPDLWLTNTWDGLNRLTGTLFQDGSTVSNIYTVLDLTGHKDRMGNWTYAGFDGLEHPTAITNANNAVTLLSWCGCGALTSITDALTNTTSFFYNNQGLLTNTLYPDGSSLARIYDSAERLTSASDGLGRALNFFYNNQGLVTTVSNTAGPLGFVVYDALDRPIQITDANNITITNQFDLLNRITLRTWQDGIGEGFLWASNGLAAYTNRDNQVTRYGRDTAGRLLTITNANLEVTQLGYNALDQVISLIDGLNHTTTWNFNQYGWLTNKVDALSQSVLAFGYNANGWVTNRWTPQMGNTAYSLDAVGNILAVIYPLSTNTFAYNALNRLTNMVDGVGASAFGYTATGQLQSETGPWPSNGVSLAYTQGLRTSFSINYPLSTINYSYDAAWRLTGLTTPAGPFSYAYDAQRSTLPTLLTLGNYSTITNHYDFLARLDYTALVSRWGNVLDGQAYQFDPLGLRTNIVRYFGLGSNNVSAGYDSIGQITSWKGQESSGLPRLNEQIQFVYDAAHNMHVRLNGVTEEQVFNCDPLNELTNEIHDGALFISGNTPAPATNVTVAGQSAQTYGDFTFVMTNATFSNGASVYQIVAQNEFGLAATNNLTLTLPSPVNPQYDANGSLTNDGTRAFAYDPENRLTNVNVAGAWKSEFAYDGLGRRRIERDYAWQSGAWNKTNELRFIYDGWLLVQVRDASNNVLVTYTRGLDLTGTRTGAGGIGGLLARTDGNGSTYYHSDGEGNVTALIDGYQLIQARYLYDPFGRMLGKWGALADANAMQFSSMPHHNLSGLSLYPFRDTYDPTLTRFLNQDPIGERGGINLYRLAGNSPPNFVDPYGLYVPLGGPNLVAQMLSSSAGTSATTAAATGAAEGAGAVLGGSALLVATAGAAALLVGDVLGVSRDAETNPTGVNGPPGTAQSPLPVGAIFDSSKEYRDNDGNIRDLATGDIVRDKDGRPVCKKKPADPPNKLGGQLAKTIPDDQKGLLRQLFGNGPEGAAQALQNLQQGGSLPEGLTQETLQTYQQIAQSAIDNGIDTVGTQAARLPVIQQALTRFK